MGAGVVPELGPGHLKMQTVSGTTGNEKAETTPFRDRSFDAVPSDVPTPGWCLVRPVSRAFSQSRFFREVAFPLSS